jgi:plasmid maintenance system antidote protein VapI
MTNQGALTTLRWLLAHPTVSATDLARRCGMHKQQLNFLLRGQRTPTLEQAIELNKHARVPFGAWLVPAGDD